jgi:hypothetical protein
LICISIKDHLRRVRYDSVKIKELAGTLLMQQVLLVLDDTDFHPLDVAATVDWLKSCGAADIQVWREGHEC